MVPKRANKPKTLGSSSGHANDRGSKGAVQSSNHRLVKKTSTRNASDLAAKQELLSRLQRLLGYANSAFSERAVSRFSDAINDIPDVVARLQPYVRKRADRQPFWLCVKAVDHAWPKLRLIQTLDRLVERSIRIPPAPLAELLRRRAAGSLNRTEEAIVDAWSERGFAFPPPDLPGALPLLLALATDEFKAKDTALTASIINALRERGETSLSEFRAYAAYLDFEKQRAQWRDAHLEAHEGLNLLLSALENREYQLLRDRVIQGGLVVVPSDEFQKERKRKLASERQKKLRSLKIVPPEA